MSNTHITPVGDASFDELVLKSDRPVLIKFATRHCGPCRALSPIVDRIAAEVAGRYRVFSVDIDDAPRVATRYGISAVPTLLAFANGAPKGQLVGLASREAILKLIA